MIVNWESLESAVNLARENYTKVAENFGIEIDREQIDNHQEQLTQKLYYYLVQTSKILQPDQSIHSINQYQFLRSVWQQKPVKETTSDQIQDKFDDLNRKISTIKYRTRQLVVQQNQIRKGLWQRQLRTSRKSEVWDHPIFQILNQNVIGLGMKCTQLENKIDQVSKKNDVLSKKYMEMQTKALTYKQKGKKAQKQMFQLAKKKAQLQKQVLQRQNQPTKPQPENKQNTPSLNSHSQFLILLEQDHKSQRPSIQSSLVNSVSIRDKYRHVKNISRRSIVQMSPNTSMDSIKSVKFQRTSGKKLIIKGI